MTARIDCYVRRDGSSVFYAYGRAALELLTITATRRKVSLRNPLVDRVYADGECAKRIEAAALASDAITYRSRRVSTTIT